MRRGRAICRTDSIAAALVCALLTGSLGCAPHQELPCPENTSVAWLEASPESGSAVTKEARCVSPDGIPHGPAFTWSGSRLKSVRQFKNGALHGTAVSWNDTGSLEVVQSYAEGQKVGTTRIWNGEGDLTDEIRYLSDGRTAVGRTLHPNGAARSSYTTVEGELEGEYRSWFPSGEIHSQGEYAHGKKQGPWTCRDKPGAEPVIAKFDQGVLDPKDSSGTTKPDFDKCLLASDQTALIAVSSR